MSRKSKERQQVGQRAAVRPISKSPVLPEILDGGLPGQSLDTARRLLISQQTTTVSHSFSGPFPPPEVLKQYEAIVPGAAKAILDQAQMQTEHRTQMERKVTDSDIRRSFWGLVAGFLISFVCVTGGIASVLLGHDGAGATIATGSVVGLAAVFIYGTASRKREREEKARIMTGQNPRPTPAATSRIDSPNAVAKSE